MAQCEVEEAYLKAYDSMADARASLGRCISFSTIPRDSTNHLTEGRQTAFTMNPLLGCRFDPRMHLSHCPIFGVHF